MVLKVPSKLNHSMILWSYSEFSKSPNYKPMKANVHVELIQYFFDSEYPIYVTVFAYVCTCMYVHTAQKDCPYFCAYHFPLLSSREPKTPPASGGDTELLGKAKVINFYVFLSKMEKLIVRLIIFSHFFPFWKNNITFN